MSEIAEKIIELIDEKNIHVYACDWNPNGTNDVVFCEGSQVFACIPELTFGVKTLTKDQLWLIYGESIVYMDLVNQTSDACCVKNLSASELLNRLAISPMHNVNSQLNKIWDAINSAKG